MTRNAIPDSLAARVAVLLVFVGFMWFIRGLDSIGGLGTSAMGTGIIPRTVDGLSGILVAPFVHGDWSHLIANTVPLLILGGIILLRGVPEFLSVTLVIVAISGLGTWLFGGGGVQHVGASGIVFGFAGFLLFRAAFDRRLWSVVIAAVLAVTCATQLLFGLIPQAWFSWSLHFFGFVGGVAAARIRYPHRAKVDPRVTAALSVLEITSPKDNERSGT